MRQSVRLLVPSLLLLASACTGGGNRNTPHEPGAEAFTSQAPGTSGGTRTDGSGGPTAAPGPAAPGAPTPASAPGGAPRAIEEADVYKRVGTTLFVLNAYRGLQILDVQDLSQPRLLSRVPAEGTPVDLYVRGTIAFVLQSDAFRYVPTADGARPERTSRLLAVDVADPAAPRVVADLGIAGQVTDSRLVGDVLYVVSRRWSWYGWIGPVGPLAADVQPPLDTTFVASFSVADPAHPAAVDEVEFPSAGWDVHAHVTAERVTLSFAGWSFDGGGSCAPGTRFQVVDISDAAGRLALGASFEARGLVRDRWGMDHDAATGLFRAVLDTGVNAGAALEIWSSPAPGSVTPLSRLAVPVQESLTAARFDGPRVYFVTAMRIDPLWVVDASDPAKPVVAGELTMPGQLDFLEPRGDRIVALGHTNEAGQPFQLAVSLIDVTSLSAPRLLSRATFGAGFGWVSARADDLRKAFLVFDPPPASLGLVLVPLQGWEPGGWTWVSGTQLLDLSRDAVVARGFLGHPGIVTRAFPADAGGTRLVALSDQALQTIDAADRAAPRELARLDLARPVSTLAIVRGKAVELSGDWYRGDTELVVTPAEDPEAAVALARVHVPAPSARMFRLGDVIWLLARDWATGTGWLQAVDFTDPVHPVVRGKLDLSAADAPGLSPGWWGYGDEAALVGNALAIHRFRYVVCFTTPCDGGDQLRVYDLSDPDRPRLASTVDIPSAGWSWGLTSAGRFLWLTHYEWFPTPIAAAAASGDPGRFFVDRVDLGDPANPVVLEKLNVPGVLFAASPDGRELYTLETEWRDPELRTWLHGLVVTDHGTARLRGSAELAGYPSGAALGASHAWAVTTTWSASGSTSRLAAVDLSSLRVTSDQAVEGTWAWLAEAAGGKLFLQAGWNDQGVVIYGLADPATPRFERFVRTQGWVQDVVVEGARAWLPSGAYGVPVIDLAP